MVKKTKLMRQAEQRLGEPIEQALPRMIGELGQTGTAHQLEVSKATVGYWILKLGIRTERIAVMPGEEIMVKRTT